jgi:hypothetical protein
MSKKVTIPVNTSINSFFKVYIDVINPIYKLKKREKEVLEAFLKIYYSNRGMGYDKINQILFSIDVKKKLRSAIGMSEPSFNNHLVQLRKKRVLKGDTINKAILDNLPDKELEVTYKISINE